MRLRAASLALLLLFSATGCSQGPRPGAGDTGSPVPAASGAPAAAEGTISLSFEDYQVGPFTHEDITHRSNLIVGREAPGNVWEVTTDPEAPERGKVLRKAPHVTLDYYFFLLSSQPLQDFEVSAKCKVTKGEATPYVGLVGRCLTPIDFYVLRYRPKTNNIELQRTIDSVREPVKKVERTPPNAMGQWHELKMRCVGQKFSCWLDGELLYEVVDSTYRQPGAVGLWASGDADSFFDDVVIKDLGGSPQPLAEPTPKGWTVSEVDSTPGAGKTSQMVADAQGNLHLVYWNDQKRELRYATRAARGGEWKSEVVARGGQELPPDMEWGIHPSLAVGKDGRPRVAYCAHRELGTPVFAERTQDGWTHTPVDRNVGAWLTALALGPDDEPHLLYDDLYTYSVKYASRKNGLWTIKPVEKVEVMARNAPIETSLLVDSKGGPRLAYNVLAENALRYTVWGDDQWIFTTVDAAGQPYTIGTHNSLALTRDLQPRISHNESAFGQMKFSWLEKGVWKTVVVDGGAAVSDPQQKTPPDSVGTMTSLALDSKDRPHVMYYDATTGTLRMASSSKIPAKWEIVKTGVHGWAPALVIAREGNAERPVCTFFDGDSRTLKLLEGPPIP